MGRASFLALVALASGALVFSGLFGDRGWLAVRRYRARLARIESGNAALRRENEAFRREIESLRRDPAAIERIAREDLLLVRPGETVYVFPPPPVPRRARDPHPSDGGAPPASP